MPHFEKRDYLDAYKMGKIFIGHMREEVKKYRGRNARPNWEDVESAFRRGYAIVNGAWIDHDGIGIKGATAYVDDEGNTVALPGLPGLSPIDLTEEEINDTLKGILKDISK